MGTGTFIIIIVIILLLVLGFAGYFISIYNSLIRLKNNIKKSWANIDVLLKQRSDELPKLVETVKGYMKHEKGVLETVTKARTQFLSADSIETKMEASNMISGALKTLFAVSENYPELKANQNFMHLQGRISGLENEIADRREFYNESVNNFNIRIQSFPDVIIANMMKLNEQSMFAVTEADRKDVKISFD